MRKLVFLIVFFLSVSLVYAQDYVSPEELADEDGYFAEIDGVSIYYIERGDSSNPAVILIHGFGGSTFTWRDNIDAIVDAGYYVIALDLPPFGLSDKNPDIGFSRWDYADYVAGLMDVLGIESATIVGHSMGGSTTAYFAVQYPERVDNLVFVAGGIFDASLTGSDDNEADGDSGGSPLAILSSIDLESDSAAFILERALVPATFASIIETAYYDASVMTDEVVAGYARPIQIEGWAEGFIAYWTTEEENPISLDELVEVADMPVLIMWGEEDTWVSIEMGYAMDDALSNSTMISYPEVGHLAMEENIEEFNQDVITFLDGN